MRWILSNFFFNEGNVLIFIDLSLSNENSEAKHGWYDQFMILECTSSGIVKCLIGNRLYQITNTFFESIWGHFFFFSFLLWFSFRFFFTFFSFFAFCTFFRLLLLLWSICNNLDCPFDDNDEGVKRELIERVDLVQFIQQEENKCTSRSCWPIVFRSYVNNLLCNFGLFYFLVDLNWKFLWVFQTFNEFNII